MTTARATASHMLNKIVRGAYHTERKRAKARRRYARALETR